MEYYKTNITDSSFEDSISSDCDYKKDKKSSDLSSISSSDESSHSSYTESVNLDDDDDASDSINTNKKNLENSVIKHPAETLLDFYSLGDPNVDLSLKPNFEPSPLCYKEITLPDDPFNDFEFEWCKVESGSVTNFDEIIPTMHIKYPYPLDDFQKKAILNVHNNNHTLVVAHTSAGKTAVIEYAIAKAIARNRRVIYTSPLKSLSNQKYNDFSKIFDSVGIITGDVSVNPFAYCLILTTEILRGCIYRGESIISETDIIILDEAHYINDSTRGVVWEEIIIMLPRNITLLMCSATISNYKEFGHWVGLTTRREVFVVVNDIRPVPLKHYVWLASKPFLIFENNRLRRQEIKKIESIDKPDNNNIKAKNVSKFKQCYRKPRDHRLIYSQELDKCIEYLKTNNQLPTILFCFSRKSCDQYGLKLMSHSLGLNNNNVVAIKEFVEKCFSKLSDTDKNLPQIKLMQKMLPFGVGVHHGGLLPIIKETVEMLFVKGLLKVLVASETCAVGLNLPARSVVFDSLQKRTDGKIRPINQVEYTQMAGRAGRRGLDTEGYIYICGKTFDQEYIQNIVKLLVGKNNQVESKFRLTCVMLLHTASQSNTKVEDIMAKSFREFSRARNLPYYKKNLIESQANLDSFSPTQCVNDTKEDILNYIELFHSVSRDATSCLSSLYKKFAVNPAHLFPIPGLKKKKNKSNPFSPGQVFVACFLPPDGYTYFGIILNSEREKYSESKETELDVLILTKNSINLELFDSNFVEPKNPKTITLSSTHFKLLKATTLDITSLTYGCKLSYAVFRITFNHVLYITTANLYSLKNISIYDNDIENEESMGSLAHELDSLIMLYDKKFEPYKYHMDLSFTDLHLYEELDSYTSSLCDLLENECGKCPLILEHFNEWNYYIENVKLREEANDMLKTSSLSLFTYMQKKITFLKKLDYLDADGAITLKGNLATQLCIDDNLTIIECLLSNFFTNKNACQVAGYVSCFVTAQSSFRNDIQTPYNHPLNEVHKIQEVHNYLLSELSRFEMQYVLSNWDSFCEFQLCYMVYDWATGIELTSLLSAYTVEEGVFVSTLLRTFELLKKVKLALKVTLVNHELTEIVDEAITKIYRDVVSTKSLYI